MSARRWKKAALQHLRRGELDLARLCLLGARSAEWRREHARRKWRQLDFFRFE
jgi:hypothetical protein